MCLAQGPQRSDAGEARTRGPSVSSQALATTEPLRSPYVLMCWCDSNMSDLGWKVKGQPWPLVLITSHCLIRLNISSRNNDFGFNGIKKKLFFLKNPI